jgi:hypothetical protein
LILLKIPHLLRCFNFPAHATYAKYASFLGNLAPFQGKYKGLVIRRGHKRAIMAIGHKMLRIIYTLLLKKEPYQDSMVDYESLIVQRNAPRWIRVLQKFGFLPEVQQSCSVC